jgi:hypothetical protein
MQLNVLLAALVGAAIPISANPSFAQTPEQAPARQQAVQATRYGTALGLPRDRAPSSICRTRPIRAFRSRPATRPMPMWTGSR